MTIRSPSIFGAAGRGCATSLLALALLFTGSALEARDGGEAGPPENVQVSQASLSEFVFRKNATHMVMPLYPPDALAKKIAGVAVAFVRVSKAGHVAFVDAIQAPHTSIKDAVEAAVKQWTFGVVTGSKSGGDALEIDSKVTFYFSINRAGQGEVRNPEPAVAGASGATAAAPEASVSAQITDAQLVGLQKGRSAVLLDTRDRSDFAQGHSIGAVNIPADEVEARAGELPPARPVVIECHDGSMDVCRFVSRLIKARGFKEVSLLIRK